MTRAKAMIMVRFCFALILRNFSRFYAFRIAQVRNGNGVRIRVRVRVKVGLSLVSGL